MDMMIKQFKYMNFGKYIGGPFLQFRPCRSIKDMNFLFLIITLARVGNICNNVGNQT